MQQMNDFECRRLERYLFGLMFEDGYHFTYGMVLKTYKLYKRLQLEGCSRAFNPKEYTKSAFPITSQSKTYWHITYPNWIYSYGWGKKFENVDEMFRFLCVATQTDDRYTVDIKRALIVLKCLLSLTRKEPRYAFGD